MGTAAGDTHHPVADVEVSHFRLDCDHFSGLFKADVIGIAEVAHAVEILSDYSQVCPITPVIGVPCYFTLRSINFARSAHHGSRPSRSALRTLSR